MHMRKLLAILAFVAFLSSASPAYAAIEFDSIAEGSSSYSITIGSTGGNKYVFVFVRGDASAVDVGGTALTQIQTVAAHDSVGTIDLWGAPIGTMSGSQTVTITGTSNTTQTHVYRNVAQSSSIDQNGNNSNTSSASIAVTLSSGSGTTDWMVMGWDNNGGFAANSQTNYVSRKAAENPCTSPDLNACRFGDSNANITYNNTQTIGYAGSQNSSAVAASINNDDYVAPAGAPRKASIIFFGEW